jgi:hypothetical protein
MSLRILSIALVVSALAAGQSVSFGVVGGASVTEDFVNSYMPTSSQGSPSVNDSSPERYIAGGMVELRLPTEWSIEVDALYDPLRYGQAFIFPNGILNGVERDPVITWEFPLLAKYRFRWHAWRPFLEAGPSFRTAGNLNGANPSHFGAAVGAGAETRLGKFRIAPEVRYIRWAGDGPFYVQTRPDQIELLTSFTTGEVTGGERALAGRISLGVVTGVTLSPAFQGFQQSFTFLNGAETITSGYSYSSGPPSFLVGPMVEAAVGKGFFIEADAIHWPMPNPYKMDSNGESLRLLFPPTPGIIQSSANISFPCALGSRSWKLARLFALGTECSRSKVLCCPLSAQRRARGSKLISAG